MKRFPWLVILLMWGSACAVAQQGEELEAEVTVTGIEATRPGGGFLGLAVEGNGFVIRFYDEEKAEIPADAVRATARWNSPQKAGRQRTVLVASGPMLRSPPVVRPPLVFIAYVSLIAESGEVIESHAFNLRTLPRDD